MKKFLFVISLILITTTGYTQNNNKPQTKKKGKLTEITLYYDNGKVMQHGFYSKYGKLHGGWESYNEDGSRKCIAFYDYGVKIGTWIYWNNSTKTNVIYDNNKIISIENVDPNFKKPQSTDH